MRLCKEYVMLSAAKHLSPARQTLRCAQGVTFLAEYLKQKVMRLCVIC
jgi:hypothetical protein